MILELITATINTVKKLDGAEAVKALAKIVGLLLAWGAVALALYGLLLWLAVEMIG